jgi:hypothetical protein
MHFLGRDMHTQTFPINSRSRQQFQREASQLSKAKKVLGSRCSLGNSSRLKFMIIYATFVYCILSFRSFQRETAPVSVRRCWMTGNSSSPLFLFSAFLSHRRDDSTREWRVNPWERVFPSFLLSMLPTCNVKNESRPADEFNAVS